MREAFFGRLFVSRCDDWRVLRVDATECYQSECFCEFTSHFAESLFMRHSTPFSWREIIIKTNQNMEILRYWISNELRRRQLFSDLKKYRADVCFAHLTAAAHRWSFPSGLGFKLNDNNSRSPLPSSRCKMNILMIRKTNLHVEREKKTLNWVFGAKVFSLWANVMTEQEPRDLVEWW